VTASPSKVPEDDCSHPGRWPKAQRAEAVPMTQSSREHVFEACDMEAVNSLAFDGTPTTLSSSPPVKSNVVLPESAVWKHAGRVRNWRVVPSGQVGAPVGICVGCVVGMPVGEAVGPLVGEVVGRPLGMVVVGLSVGWETIGLSVGS